MSKDANKILIIDFGSQVTQLIARRIRELSQEHLPSHEVAKKIIKLGVSNKIALLFGNETSGLSNDEIQHCHYLGYIDANQNYSSF